MKNKKIKILYLITGLGIGGAEVLIRDMSCCLDKERFEVVILSLRPLKTVGKQIEREGGRVFSLESRFKFSPLILFRLWGFIVKEKPDIIHAHLFHADFLGRLTVLFYRRTRYVSTIHNVEFGSAVRSFLLRATRWIPHATVAVGEVVRKRAIEKRVASPKNISVIYNGIDLSRFSAGDRGALREKLGFRDDEFIFVSAGRLNRQKDFPTLIEAVCRLNKDKKNYKVIILGDGEERGALERKKEKFGVDNVELRGRVDNVNEFLAGADAFVLSSLWEGLPVSIIEAMAVGLPVVATCVGGTPELVRGRYTGFLVEPRSVYELAEKMGQALSMSGEERREMGKQGREVIGEKFSIESMASGYASLYEGLVSERVQSLYERC